MSLVRLCAGSLRILLRRGWSRRLAGEIATFFIVPGRLVVGFLFWIETRIQAIIRQLESVFDDEGRVCVIDEVVVRNAILLDGVVDQAAEERDIGSGTDLQIKVRRRSSPREARVDHDGLRIAVQLGLNGPLEAARMV